MNKKQLIEILRGFSIPLILGLLTSLLCANIFPDTYQFVISHKWFGFMGLHYFVNDIFMSFFFAVAAVDIVLSIKPGGDMNPIKLAVNPIISSIGGVLSPILIYLFLNSLIGSQDYIHGFGIPTATDIALAWLFIRMIFGAKHPAVNFLLILAIVDDIIGLFIIAIFYPDSAAAVQPQYLLLVAAGMIYAFVLRQNKVSGYKPYIFIGGSISWLGLFFSHLHPALALCFIVPFIPTENIENQKMFKEGIAEKSPLSMFEHRWRIIVDFGWV